MEEVAISFNVLFIICITSYKYTSTFPYNNKGSGNVIGSSSPTHVFNFNAVGPMYHIYLITAYLNRQ